jgi:hypothetical protein
MSEKHAKKSKWVFIISVIIGILLTVSLCIVVYISQKNQSLLPQYYPISEIDSIIEPHIDLRDLEKSVKLEYEPADEYSKFKDTSSYIRRGGIEIFTTSIFQYYNVYSLETGEQLFTDYILPSTGEKVAQTIRLETDYFKENETQTMEKALNRYPFSMADSSDGGNELVDERFEKCWVNTFSSGIYILVIKNKQIMCLQYDGGNLNPEDFLDELARIL